jgi:hypothetical protein
MQMQRFHSQNAGFEMSAPIGIGVKISGGVDVSLSCRTPGPLYLGIEYDTMLVACVLHRYGCLRIPRGTLSRISQERSRSRRRLALEP